MTDRTRNIAVGLTAIVGIVGLLVMMLLFGYVPTWLESVYTVRVHFPTAAGLTHGSAVRLNGIGIGTVDSVRLAKGETGGVVVDANVREGVKVPRDVQARVSRPLLVGGSSTLQFQTDKPINEATEYLPTDGSAFVQGKTSSLVTSVTQQLQKSLDKPIKDIGRVADAVDKFGKQWTTVGENINQLIEPRTPEQVDSGEAPRNLSSAIKRADARLAELRDVIQGLEKYATDAQLRKDIRQTAANARKLSEALPKRLDEFSENVNENMRALRQRYMALADDLSKAVQSMNTLLSKVQRGEGTAGKLVNDPSLYQNLNDAVQRAQKAMDEMRLLFQKWKAEGLPVQF